MLLLCRRRRHLWLLGTAPCFYDQGISSPAYVNIGTSHQLLLDVERRRSSSMDLEGEGENKTKKTRTGIRRLSRARSLQVRKDAVRLAKTKSFARAVLFLVCLGLFIWQAYEIIAEYNKKEIATKVIIEPMNSTVSRFDVAFCLDAATSMMPVRFQDPLFGSVSYAELHHLDTLTKTGPDWVAKNVDSLVRDVGQEFVLNATFLFDDNHKAQIEDGSVTSLYHPLFGLCAVLPSSSLLVQRRRNDLDDDVGSHEEDDEIVLSVAAEVKKAWEGEDEFVTFRGRRRGRRRRQSEEDGEAERDAVLFPRPPPFLEDDQVTEATGPINPRPTTTTLHTHPPFPPPTTTRTTQRPATTHPGTSLRPFHALRLEKPFLFKKAVGIFVFEPGQFIGTVSGEYVQEGQLQRFEMQQYITDKREISHHLEDECDPSPILDEDSCLFSCLIDEFLLLAKCVHPRLLPLIERIKLTHGDPRYRYDDCTEKDLSALALRGVVSPRSDDEGKSIDPGVLLIRKLLLGFSKDSRKHRCGCRKPCVRRFFDLKKWGQDDLAFDGSRRQLYLALKRDFVVYEDSATFDFVKMLADLGGYLGLMLGYSAYSVASLIDVAWRLKQKWKSKGEDEDVDAERGGTQREGGKEETPM